MVCNADVERKDRVLTAVFLPGLDELYLPKNINLTHQDILDLQNSGTDADAFQEFDDEFLHEDGGNDYGRERTANRAH
eukprot:scaffold544426_cov46-Prasinocladus_malaysianus.AAC.1